MMRLSGHRRKLQQLLKKYLSGTVTDQEKGFVQWYYQSFERTPDFLASKTKAEKEIIKDRIRAQVPLGKKAPVFPLRKIATWAAAAAVILLITGLLFLDNKQSENKNVISHLPAIDKAILTQGSGQITAIGGQGDLLDNRLAGGPATGANKYNFISLEIPKGCKYHFKLEDGTEVWLNPGSKMHIPLDYGKNNRTVSLWGEAYFSVVHKANLPFHVLTPGLNIKDIGTEFKVRAYPFQKTTVTLAKGSITVYDSINNRNFSLDDIGEQVLLDPESKTSRLLQVDTAFATSLKNNLFYFDHASIDQVVQEISQWYNVEFELKGSFHDIFFTGSIRRDSRLQEVLKILQLSNLNYEWKDDVIVLSASNLARINVQ